MTHTYSHGENDFSIATNTTEFTLVLAVIWIFYLRFTKLFIIYIFDYIINSNIARVICNLALLSKNAKIFILFAF